MSTTTSIPGTILQSKAAASDGADGATILHYIQLAVERACHGRAHHLETVSVTTAAGGKTGWTGNVEIFKTQKGRVYGWAAEGKAGPRYIVSVNEPDVDSAKSALEGWLASQSSETSK